MALNLITQVNLSNSVSQYFRTHRLYQLLSWIDALSRGYESPDNLHRPADDPIINDPHRMPTVSNLAYYLLTDADYNEKALQDKFSYHGPRRTPDKEVFDYVKRDLTRHLAQYPGDLFKTKTVRKTAMDHLTFDDGLESRRVKAKAYYLSERGQTRLAELSGRMKFKRKFISKNKTIRINNEMRIIKNSNIDPTADTLGQKIDEIDSKSIKTDSITVPTAQRFEWKTKTYELPHIAVADATQGQALTVYRK